MWNQTKYLTVLAVLLLAVSSCGVKATNVADGAAGQPATAAGLPLDLPSPAKLLPTLGQGRKTSALKFTEADVQQTGVMNSNKLPAHNVASNASALRYIPDFDVSAAPTLDGLAYAGYHFNLPYYDRNAQVRLTWTVPPASSSDYFIAVANWHANRWDWFPGNADNKVYLPGMDDYISTFDDIAVVVAVIGTADVQLGSVRIGGLPPVAAITVADPIGATPYLPTLDASASTDPEGLPLTYQYDFDGDGVFESLVGTNPTVEYNYGSNGDYQPAVKVTNSINASSTATVSIHAVGEWSRTLGSNGGDYFADTAVDHAGNLYAVGVYDHLQNDLLLTKWTPAGALLWAKAWDSGDADYGAQLALDSDGNLIVGGDYEDNNKRIVLLQKYTPDGDIVWSKKFGGTSADLLFERLVVTGTQIFCAISGKFSGDLDIAVARVDGDGGMAWSAYRTGGSVDIVEDMQLIYDIGGAKRLAVLSESTIGGGSNLWKVEFNMDGTFGNGQQLGTSAQPKHDGKFIYYYDIFPNIVRYYVAGQTDVNGDYQFFMVATDGSGANLWGKRYPGLDMRPNFLTLGSDGRLLTGGQTDKQGFSKLGLASLTSGGTDLGLRFSGNSSSNVMLYDECSSAGGMVMVGQGVNSTLFESNESLPSPNSFYHDFQTLIGSGGDAGLYSTDTNTAQQTDVTDVVVLNSGGGGYDCMIARRNEP